MMTMIIPMVGMFDMGLNSATLGGNYDAARALANANLEKVKALPYQTALTAYKSTNASPTAGTTVDCDQGVFQCEVETTFVEMDSSSVVASTTSEEMMQVDVTVTWSGGSNSYSTTGLVAEMQAP
jgi:hypothetical protein